MSIVYVTNVVVGRNPASLMEPFEFEISFECLEPLEQDLEWRLIYVGSAEDKSKDQELDSIALGPIQRGALRFIFTADPPDYTKIAKEDLNGITIILLSSSYRNQEFVRVGWYVQNFFFEPQFIENPPDLDEMTVEDMVPRMKRVILADNPRVTRFNIDWDRPNLETSFVTMETEAFDQPDRLTNSIESSGVLNGTNLAISPALGTRMTENARTAMTPATFPTILSGNLEQGLSSSSLADRNGSSHTKENRYSHDWNGARELETEKNDTDNHIVMDMSHHDYHLKPHAMRQPFDGFSHVDPGTAACTLQCITDSYSTIPEDTEMATN